MKFAEVITAAGFKPKDYPRAAQLEFALHSGSVKEHEILGPRSNFAPGSFFVSNQNSYQKFGEYLSDLELSLMKAPDYSPTFFVKVTETRVFISQSEPDQLLEIFHRQAKRAKKGHPKGWSFLL